MSEVSDHIQETVDELSNQKTPSEMLESINQAISGIHTIENKTDTDIEKGMNTLLGILNEISSDPDIFDIVGAGSAEFDIDYSHLNNFSQYFDEAQDELFFDAYLIRKEILALGNGNLDNIVENKAYTYEYLYENKVEWKKARNEYITRLEEVESESINIYPNPVKEGEAFNISINHGIIQQGKELFNTYIRNSFPRENTQQSGILNIPNTSESIDSGFGLNELSTSNYISGTEDFIDTGTEYRYTITESRARNMIPTFNTSPLTITDINGKQFYSQETQTGGDAQGNMNIKVAGGMLEKGIYIVRLPITISGKNLVHKIIVQ